MSLIQLSAKIKPKLMLLNGHASGVSTCIGHRQEQFLPVHARHVKRSYELCFGVLQSDKTFYYSKATCTNCSFITFPVTVTVVFATTCLSVTYLDTGGDGMTGMGEK